MYIYKLGTECDGAQMRASVVYIPTLVALLGLCFDPSECFQDLHIWSRVMGNKSGKLRYMSQIVTIPKNHTTINVVLPINEGSLPYLPMWVHRQPPICFRCIRFP